ncbi:hypothetical protein J010_07025 [Cryptococcus neoformans]|nr:hypothetical protein C355_07008 [Cryptococcus neoformans var. grubii Th84]OXH00014.1 hypothetical protein J010_07025 [Cryptococcus neoformans var. grubii]OXH21025.1 hypothetical protein J009_07016 [Cryptococcus neoformans var. grubii]OXH40745.1 hypothetical protein J004_07066 [Cryptococcus neoformans var. grubii]OXH41816.1 hypothetical protein J003_07018 [Cryptococcus neoformans var. grubii]
MPFCTRSALSTAETIISPPNVAHQSSLCSLMGMSDSYNHAQISSDNQIVINDEHTDRPKIKSSTFCKVLRIVAGLAPPAPKSLVKGKDRAPTRRPPVWAESRQELCEALPYYRSFQSGLYMYKKVAYGYLLEAFPAPRDIWADNGRVIISHGGGQCICPKLPDGTQGPPTLQADQSPLDARVETLLLAAERRTPLVLIAGEGYGQLPWKLDCAYVVLGWYWISYTWAEAEPVGKGVMPPRDRDYFHRYKIRFDWVNNQGEPWWDCESQIPLNLGTSPKNTPATTDLQTPGCADTLEEGSSISLGAAARLTIPVAPLRSTREFSGCLDYFEDRAMYYAAENCGEWPGDKEMTSCLPTITDQTEEPSIHLYDTFVCPNCHEKTPLIYKEGQICVKPSCPAFFLLRTTCGLFPIPPGFTLTFNPPFLLLRPTPISLANLPYDLIPPTLDENILERTECKADLGGRTLWKGWVCTDCERANCRYRWEVWECRHCGNLFAPLNLNTNMPLSGLSLDFPPFMGDAMTMHTGRIMMLSSMKNIAIAYDLPDAGTVYHVISHDRRAADKLFHDYQVEAAGGFYFQRRALKANTVKGALLAQHFAVNSGVPYKYNVDTLSVPFDQSPSCVMAALNLISSGTSNVLKVDTRFNEILSVIYREGQKMGWHDDGEPGLGPVVASLCLGSPADISFRSKANRANGTFGAEVALSFTLSHGDIMIMQGRDIQKQYHHRAMPYGLRIAATARMISDS